jgi:hypothetical protein
MQARVAIWMQCNKTAPVIRGNAFAGAVNRSASMY